LIKKSIGSKLNGIDAHLKKADFIQIGSFWPELIKLEIISAKLRYNNHIRNVSKACNQRIFSCKHPWYAAD